MHTRDYSEDTSRVIDAEISRILRDQEKRSIELLGRHRGGLDAVARALLERETIDGEEVGRLVDTAYGRPVHENGAAALAKFTTAPVGAPESPSNGSVDGEPGATAEPAGTTTD